MRKPPGTRGAPRSRGQVIVLFAASLLLLIGMAALTIDVSWWWVNTLRVQRAADAAALAGAVMLPNDTTNAYALARAEATKNGYQDGAGATVTPVVDPTNPRRLRVTISASVESFFAGAVGISTFGISKVAVAEFGLPADVGKPSKGPLALSLAKHNQDSVTPWVPSRASSNSPQSPWIHPDKASLFSGSIDNRCNEWARTIDCSGSGNNTSAEPATQLPQIWGDFSVQSATAGMLPNDPSLQILGISARATVFLFGTGISSGCKLTAELSSNNRVTWTTPVKANTTMTPAVTFPMATFVSNAWTGLPAGPNITFGGPSDLWGRTWTYADFKDDTPNVFSLRLTFVHNAGCAQTVHMAIDTLDLAVNYRVQVPDAPSGATVNDPYGNALTPSNYWPAMLSQGDPPAGNTSGNGAGDAFLGGSSNTTYDPTKYYRYLITIPSNGGEVWLYDAGFCDTAINSAGDARMGIGDDWLSGNGPVTAYYELFKDTPNTPYDFADDTAVTNSGTKFRRLRLFDPDQGGDFSNAAATSCKVPLHADWHNTWWRLANNLTAGTYRLHAASRNSSDATDDQSTVRAQNVFGIWAKSTSGTASVTGLGTATLFVPLAPNTSTDIPLVQLDASYADKTLTVDLWDPGDTAYQTVLGSGANPTTSISLLMPTASGYSAASVNSNSVAGTTIGSLPCGPGVGTAATSIQVSANSPSSAQRAYQGKWLRLCFRLPSTYAAPVVGSDPAGLWKLRYTLGTGAIPKEDMVTVRLSVAGNPVHLVVP